jgi:ring-1,2-phenylacetyl-CoA epoxidase subunit PaaD
MSIKSPLTVKDTIQHIWQLLEQVKDPEIPVVSIVDLGIARQIDMIGDTIEIIITPTYSGCPAMHEIESDIFSTLARHDYPNVRLRTVLAPAWTTDWISETGRRKFEEYGIAPPQPVADHADGLMPLRLYIRCPHCSSLQTRQLSEFASTACKALYQCENCLEPFDYFKAL